MNKENIKKVTDNEILEKILNEIDSMSQEELKQLEDKAKKFLNKIDKIYK